MTVLCNPITDSISSRADQIWRRIRSSFLNVMITGTDSQIDDVLDKFSDSELLTYALLGVNEDIGDFLLGDF